jgi:hypothetical protein
MARRNCTEVTAACPVQASTIGYYPSIGANAVPAIIFLIALIIQLVIGIRRRTWSYLVAVGIGSLLETAGYVGRVMLHKNPYSSGGFKLQIISLTVAPAFIAAGLYLNLKHMVYVFGPHLSLLKPALYTYIFICCDIFSIAMQAVGTGLAAAGTDVSAASNIILAGLSFQVFTMVVFGLMSGIFFLKVSQNRGELKPETVELRNTPKFKWFLVSLALAYTTILVRCIFRVAAFAGGWRNSLELNQTDFIALDTV